ncbi:MAG: immunoglobulin domain-containing protein, partial [Verrucomicrobia bacterium]|nr:immunoglobulin domain-containing protein [Verrucomicrobiota bacterium]
MKASRSSRFTHAIGRQVVQALATAMLLFIGGLTASAQTYQQEGLLPLTVGSYWMQDNGHVAAVVSATDSGDTLSVLITNWNGQGQPIIGYLRLVADATEVRGTGYSNPDYIIVDDDMGYYPFLKRPMTSGRTWNSQWTSNGYPIYQTAVVTGTNLLLAIGSTIHNGCTELTVTSSYPNGYTPGQVKWVNSKYYFSPGVGCVRRILTSDTGLKQTNNVVAWRVNGFSSRPIGFATMPASQTASAGGVTTFSASAFGLQPLKYAWRKNGTNLVNGGRVTGATSTNLNLSNTQAADSGRYSVVVSNAYGSVTSAVAVLNVVTPPSSFVLLEYFNPLVAGNEWHYTGTDYDGQPSTRVDRVASRNYSVTAYTGRATPRTYTTNLVRLNKAYGAPTYDDWDDFFSDQGALAFWGNDDGSDSGRVDGGLVLPPSLNLGQSASVTRDFYDGGVYQGSVTFKLTAVSWGSVTVPAGTFEDCLKVRIVITGGGQSETQEEWWVRGIGAVKHRNVPDNGEERLDLVNYSVVAPVRIVTPPRAQTNSLGGVATFSVSASGSPPLSYQWRKNDADLADNARISGASSNILVIAGLEFADAGSYSVRVANDHDSAVSAAAQLVVADKLSPVLAITSHTELQLLGGASTVLAGTASDAGLGNNGIAAVTINGLRATNDTAAGTGTASWSRAVNLTLGTNRFTIVARDGQGNATTNILRLRADTARPTLTLTAPKLNQRWSNSVFTVTGKAADNLGVTEVRYQLNELDWTPAIPSPSGWSNWTAQVLLTPGTNTLRAYA